MIGLILCGGKGTRIQPITNNTPKPLIKLNNKEILTYIIENFRKYGIDDIYITTKHKKELFNKYAKKHNIKTLKLPKDFEKESGNIWPLQFDDDVLISVGDTITNIDISDLIKFHKKNKSDFTITSKILDYRIPFGTMKKKGNILKEWIEKPSYRVEVALGLFLVNKNLFKLIPKRKFNIPDFIKLALKNHKVCVYPYYNDYIKIDTMKEYEDAKLKIDLLHLE